ncbi:hypothetical protein GS399_09530 [Pedobacter sp. HMF7647]|uniref:Uncharacterized protein n=1 Tax=Hufsiella arboris TaxID=2695275 RepID=A0A7K1YAS6_9SPHI|nr:hypothetical protein [Hufsiella arboris]MXV51209.1 hypothetical protein [Hufsiella arboris]
MIISPEILKRFKIEPEFLKNGKVKYRLFNHYVMEILEKNGRYLYEVFWENWGRKISFSSGELKNEDDFIYFIEYSEECVSSFE